jgi:DNA-binding beta-propeller fold protein YncE
MRIKMSLRLAGLLGLLLLAVAGCGRASTATNTTKSVQLPRGETLYVLDGYAGTTATQRILAFQPGKGTSALLTLPAGVTSYDHTTLYAASATAGHTTIAVINTRTGGTLRSIALAGSYETAGPGYGASTISPDGKWLALRQSGTTGGTTTIALLDTQAGRLAKTVSLPGDFELDAISPDGQVLYLIENLHDAAHHYYVKAYDVASATLGDWVIIDKTEIENPKMQGTALTRQMAPDGSVAYTLYINAAQNSASSTCCRWWAAPTMRDLPAAWICRSAVRAAC